jgi:hypothetical protein
MVKASNNMSQFRFEEFGNVAMNSISTNVDVNSWHHLVMIAPHGRWLTVYLDGQDVSQSTGATVKGTKSEEGSLRVRKTGR